MMQKTERHNRIDAALILGIALAFILLAAGLAQSAPRVEGGNTTFILLAKKSVASQLPTCYGPDCRGRLQDVKIYLVNPIVAYGEAWLWHNGVSYHALVWRINVHADWYLWAWQGHPIWFRAIKYVADGVPSADVEGPASWLATDLLPQAQCRVIANGAMINVTTDAGTLLQPGPVRYCQPVTASDAGSPDACHTENRTWPDGAIITCSGSGYWLARNRFGGQPGPGPGDVQLGAPVDAGVPPVGSGGNWAQPDAATTHNCYGVPIGTPCP